MCEGPKCGSWLLPTFLRTPQFIQYKFCKHNFSKNIHLINCPLGWIYLGADLSWWPCVEFMGSNVHGWMYPQLTSGGGTASSEWNFRTIRFYEPLLSEEVRPLHIVWRATISFFPLLCGTETSLREILRWLPLSKWICA